MDEQQREPAARAVVSDDLTEALARSQLARHAMADGQCAFCEVAWPCRPVELAESALTEIARRRRGRQRDQ